MSRYRLNRYFYIGKDGININEGGYVLTFRWNPQRRFLRVWFKPGWYAGGPQWEFRKCY